MVEFPRQNRQVQKMALKNADNSTAAYGQRPQADPQVGSRVVPMLPTTQTKFSPGNPHLDRAYFPQGNGWTLNYAGVIPGGGNPRGSVDRHPRLANREVSDMPDAIHQTAPAARCPYCGVAPDRRAPRPQSTKEAALAFIAECRRKLAGGAR